MLLLYLSERRWAKLCYEFSPQRKPTAVTVVTHGTSDDSNSFETAGGPLWLRITRSGRVWAFHASVDGAYWQLLRYFTLGEASGARVGFLAQSPTGAGCTAILRLGHVPVRRARRPARRQLSTARPGLGAQPRPRIAVAGGRHVTSGHQPDHPERVRCFARSAAVTLSGASAVRRSAAGPG